MQRDTIIDIFNDLLNGKREKIEYSEGYKEFEEIYEELKEYLTKEENNGICKTIIIRKRKNV